MEEDPTAGHVGHLTLDEERLLQQCWVHILRLCGHEDIGKKPATVNGNTDANGETAKTNGEDGNTNGEATNTNGNASRTNGEAAISNGDASRTNAGAVTTNGDATKTNGGATESKDAPEPKEVVDTNEVADAKNVADTKDAANPIEIEPEILRTTPDKTAHFQKVMHHKTPEAFRHGFWEFVKTDHPDSLVLRFLRARKWDPVQAIEMLVSAVSWRSDHNMEETIARQGEAVALKESPTKDDINFIEQYRSGKCYVRGIDIHNHPVYSVKVKHHHPHQQSSKTMENFVLHNIESLRVLAREPNDKACLIFDLTGFGLRNMDFHLVKFILEVFEARYPETLALIIIHNAPFVFWGMFPINLR